MDDLPQTLNLVYRLNPSFGWLLVTPTGAAAIVGDGDGGGEEWGDGVCAAAAPLDGGVLRVWRLVEARAVRGARGRERTRAALKNGGEETKEPETGEEREREREQKRWRGREGTETREERGREGVASRGTTVTEGVREWREDPMKAERRETGAERALRRRGENAQTR